MAEQRNTYRGNRPWLRIGIRVSGGVVRYFDLVADTGSAGGIILRADLLAQVRFRPLPPRQSNFGQMTSGMVKLDCPDVGLTADVVAYGSDPAAATVARADPGFVGLVGLPVLRLGEYGGNADSFWFRYPPT